jgi:hypothetical protein
VCIFCGEKPQSKTKEHVIPKWLIALTGDTKRDGFWGLDASNKNDIKPRIFPFDKLTFPACSECNNKFGETENRIKPIIIKILSEEKISCYEISDLLTWFDKVRTGLWLGSNYLEKNSIGIKPKFHISTRTDVYDRMLIIKKVNSTRKRLSILGMSEPVFQMTPSAFGLIINDIILLNISYVSLFSGRLGYPHMNLDSVVNKDQYAGTASPGTNKIKKPLIRNNLIPTINSTIIYQPVFSHKLSSIDCDSYYKLISNNTYLNEFDGIGRIFIQNGQELKTIDENDKIKITPNKPSNLHESIESFNSTINILKWQLYTLELTPSKYNGLKDDEKDLKDFIKTIRQLQNLWINTYKIQIKKYKKEHFKN